MTSFCVSAAAGLHSSVGRVLQCWLGGHGFKSCWSPENILKAKIYIELWLQLWWSYLNFIRRYIVLFATNWCTFLNLNVGFITWKCCRVISINWKCQNFDRKGSCDCRSVKCLDFGVFVLLNNSIKSDVLYVYGRQVNLAS